MEDGRVYWSNWSGMSDVANAVQVQRGLGSSKLAISSVGGTVNIISRAAGRKEGGFARFMTGNDSYFKGTISYDSGLKGKWAYSFLLDIGKPTENMQLVQLVKDRTILSE